MSNSRLSLALSASIAFLLISSAAAQSPSVRPFIHGTVRDAITHRGLPYVIVTVEEESSGYAGHAETDTSGNFNFQGVAAGVYIVRVRFAGYEEASQRVDLTVVSSNYASFELRPIAGNSPPASAPEAQINARLASVPEKARKEYLKARDLWQAGKDVPGCIEHLQKAIKDYPQFGDAYVLLATADMQQNYPAGAKSALDRAIEVDPKMPEAWLTLGMLQTRQKDYPAAEKSLLRGLELDDKSVQGHYELARTYFAAGQIQDAETQALKAEALQPEMAPVHILLGNIALRKRDAASALKEFQEYLRLEPKGPMAQGAADMVSKIQSAFSAPPSPQ